MDKKNRSSKIIEFALSNAGIKPSCCKRLLFKDYSVPQEESKKPSNSHIDHDVEVFEGSTYQPGGYKVHESVKSAGDSFIDLDNQNDIANVNGSQDIDVPLTSDNIVTVSLNCSQNIDVPSTSDVAVSLGGSQDIGVPLTSPDIVTISLGDNQDIGVPSTSADTDIVSFNGNRDFDVPSTSSGVKNCTKNKVGKRKYKRNLNYIDYISDEEDFSTFYGDNFDDSDNWSETQRSDSEDTDEPNSKRKKGKKGRKNKVKVTNNKDDTESRAEEEKVGDTAMKDKKVNERKERSRKKKAGEEYQDKKGLAVPAKTILPNPCLGKKCGNDCGSLPEEKRNSIFQHFWKLDSVRRRDWLVSVSQVVGVKRKRSDSEKRTCTIKYFVNEGEGKRNVCLKFLAATINISDKTIYNTIKNATWGCAKEDLRGKSVPPNKTKQTTLDALSNFIKNLPAVPSHYCRQDSNKVYLPEEFKNLANLYNIYKKNFLNQCLDVVSERIFRKIFKEQFNIGFHIPKKDKCLKCLQFENTDDPNKLKLKEEHEKEKQESYSRFRTHKTIHKDDPKTLCASFDLEKVLNTPYSPSMMMYYSRKLAVYNLCVYENGTRNVFCYYWDESNGKRGANEVATILNRYIKSVDARGNIKRLLLYCDCCPGQNRNRIILSMIHTTLQECNNLSTIQINFLLTGHTYMPVDSVHAMIENKLKNSTIYAPSQWFTIFSTARQDPFPFEVERLSYEDFYKWDSISDKYFKGNLMGKISKIRIMTFKKSKNNIEYKMSMNAAAESFCVDVQSKTKVPILPCYRSLVPISKAKYDDLKKLCNDKVIPSCFHHEYINIPFTINVKDTLPDSDIEDQDCTT